MRRNECQIGAEILLFVSKAVNRAPADASRSTLTLKVNS